MYTTTNSGTNEKCQNFDYEANGSLNWGEKSTTTSLINIVKASVTIDQENFNIIPSLEQKYYVKMSTNLIPIEKFEKDVEPNMVDLNQKKSKSL